MITHVLSSYLTHEPDLLLAPKIIVCDKPKLSTTGKRSYKSGIVLEDDYPAYEEYVCQLERMARDNAYPFINARILRCEHYRGFAFAIRDALELVTTDLILVIQHDRALNHPFDLLDVCTTMTVLDCVKYVGLSTANSHDHLHRMRSKYKLDLSPGTLSTLQDRDLAPLMFWYDSTHIAKAAHYRNFVFGWHSGPDAPCWRLGTGDFIEDKLGQLELNDIKAHGLAAHARYGTYVLASLEPLVQHWHGRKMGTSEARKLDNYTRKSARRPSC